MDEIIPKVETQESEPIVEVSCWWVFKILIKRPQTNDNWEEVRYIHNVNLNPIEALKPLFITINKEQSIVTKIIFKEGGFIYVKEKPVKIMKILDIETFEVN